MKSEPKSDFFLRDVEHDDLPAVLTLNQSAVPAVGSIDIERIHWFAEHACYFRVVMRDTNLAAYLIGLRPGTAYRSPNYRWFCQRYDDFGYIDRVAVHASARRNGLATRLYDDFRNSLPRAVRVLTCEVNIEPPNESSMTFHRRYGFEAVGTLVTEGGTKQVALLAKELNT